MGMSMRRIRVLFELPYEVKEDDEWYVASCRDLDVHSQGKTRKQAIANLREALILFLTSALERGVLDQVLKEAGYSPRRAVPTRSKHPQKYLDIPLHLMTTRGHAQARAG
jgi:predicted RNase H-like HicB family nuclease